MDDVQGFSSLVDHIYDAALDPTRWVIALDKTAAFVGWPAGALYSKDPISKTGRLFHVSGVTADYVQSYFEKYVRLDPFTTARFFFPVQQVVSCADVMTHNQYRETTFYKEWAKPQGWVDFVSASLEKSLTRYAECGIFRHARNGVTDEAARRKLGLIISHIRRAVTIADMLDVRALQEETIVATLDLLTVGVFLVDGKGRIAHANRVGRRLLDSRTALRRDGDRLSA